MIAEALMDLPFWAQESLEELAARTENAPWHLALIAWLVLAGMVIRAALIRGQLEASRQEIPLSVGGWGTRGKSGTERLKAALFQGHRYDVVVKTTGCEAMFIHARRDLPGRELFLYRPYDKATIWEQEKVMSFGSRLEGQVFLWECMALNPHFVDVLNREWMQDEVVTLTNAYPDHEDIMGPAGQDVAAVIGTFMPVEGVAYTAEEQMLPILADAAKERGSRLDAVDPLVADLLPEDLLARYPYDEHPRNIALVLALAEHFGLDRERSLVAMADYVVPDLGVLKTYPAVTHLGRTMSFSNGMSANERAGFLSNWSRLGLGEIDPETDPCTYTVAVVNNRADRVPRSRVFAEIFARDVVVDRIVCIGTNLGGLRGFIIEALERHASSITLDLTEPQLAQQQLTRLVKRLRAVDDRSKLSVRVGAMLATLVEPEGVQRICDSLDWTLEPARLQQALVTALAATESRRPRGDYPWSAGELSQLQVAVVDEAKKMAALIDENHLALTAIRQAIDAGDPAAEVKLRDFYKKSIASRVRLQEDSDADGNQTLEFVAKSFPPGFEGRLLGCQNIKGTGLDFVYRWISIGQVVALTDRLTVPDAREEALAGLAAHSDFGIADVRLAIVRLTELKTGVSLGEQVQQVDILLRRLERTHEAIAKKMSSGAKKSAWVKALGVIEPWLDHLDSVRRSTGANEIMQALFSKRISQGRAAILLRTLVLRQKGGWLAKDVEAWLEKRR